jgi:hypothetical protein
MAKTDADAASILIDKLDASGLQGPAEVLDRFS